MGKKTNLSSRTKKNLREKQRQRTRANERVVTSNDNNSPRSGSATGAAKSERQDQDVQGDLAQVHHLLTSLTLPPSHTKLCFNLAGCDLNAILAGTSLHNMGPS